MGSSVALPRHGYVANAAMLSVEGKMGDFLSHLQEDPPSKAQEPSQGLQPGQRIGAYQLQRKLGEGGMSQVYLACRADDQYRKRVAIKLAPIALVSAEHLRRFRVERHILASLEHPHIAHLLDAGATEEGMPYFVMEYVEGEPIDAYCDRHRLSIRERLKLFGQVCAAVHYAHQNLVVHRDLKPTNILVTGIGVPKLLDFGIAKLLNPELCLPSLEPTENWYRFLTPSYASPEQIRGRSITTASDTYSLGILLCQLLSGCLPFQRDGKTAQEIQRDLEKEEPLPPSSAFRFLEQSEGETKRGELSAARSLEPDKLFKRLSGDLDKIVLKTLRLEPQRRYSSVEQLAEDVRLHLEGLPVLAGGNDFAYRLSKFLRRHRVGAAFLLLVAALVTSFAALMAMQAAKVKRERDEARFERDKSQLALRFLEEVFAEAKPIRDDDEELTAEQIIERAARALEDSKNPPQVEASVMNSLGNIHRNLGLYQESERLLAGALEVRESKLGSSHQDVAESLNDLSLLLIDQGKFDEAEPLLEKALEIRRSRLGDEHSEVAETINNLGLIYQNRGAYQQAEGSFRNSLELNREIFGNDHRYVALSLNNLATSLAQAGDYEGAEAAFRDALEIQRRIFLRAHPELAKTLSNLGLILQINGAVEEAEAVLLEALGMQQTLFGKEHPDVAMVMKNLGGLFDSQGNFQRAEPFLRDAISLSQRSLGPDHLKIAVARLQLAGVLSGKGELYESEALFRKSLDSLSRFLPAGHHYLAHPLWGLGEVLLLRGDPRAALPLLRDALDIEQRAWPEGHLDVALAESALGSCLGRLGAFEEAESLVLRSYPVIIEKRGVKNRLTKRSLERVTELYEAWGRGEESQVYRSKLRELLEN